jgi:ribosomal protein S2
VNGIITNKISCFKYLSENPKAANKSSKLLFKLRNKSDLVVVFDKVTDKDALNESYLARIPVISLNCDLNLLKNKSTYKILATLILRRKKYVMTSSSQLKATFKRQTN